MRVTVLLLAAGGSTRMRGGDKLLEPLESEPLLRRSARTALDSQADAVVAVLGANRSAREAAISRLPVRCVFNECWQAGMGTSIAVGAAAIGPVSEGVIVMPADMPDLTPAILNLLIEQAATCAPTVILRLRTLHGKTGNPVLFGAAHLPALMRLDGDAGARSVIADNAADLSYINVPDHGILTDLDTPEAWASYRANRGQRDQS